MSTRPIPRDRRARELRGTPPEPAVLELATTYLEEQARLWPAAVGTLIPPPTPAAAAELAERFRVAGLPDPAAADLAVPAGAGEVAAAYLRYSSDHSNPRSLDQQLRNVLVRAAADRAFVPWAFVFADAAVTGTTAARRGYQQAKAAVRGPAAGPARLYLDELGRASRDAVEALRLGRLVDRAGKRLVGVTDGFDSALPQSKMMLALFAMLHEWFVDQLRAKVRRGMADAFGQGRTVTAPAVGYRMVAVAGPDGTPAVTAAGRPVRARAIDPAGAGHVREAFRLFADEGWSPGRVARQFNQRQVAGRTSWNRTNVVQLLTRQTYAGVEWYNRTTQQRDPDTGTVTTRTRPRDEWLRREVPDLRIVPDDLWARAQARLAAVRDAHRARAGGPTAPARTAVYPSVLVRPVCGYCRVPLWVGRSGKYPALHCHRGRDRRSGCQLRSYKSARIVDRAILDHLRPLAADPAFAARVAAAANAALAAEAARPAADVGPLRADVRRLERAQAKLVELAEQDGAGDLSAVARRLRQNEQRLTALRGELAAADARAAAPPPALTPAAVAALLADLPGLLADDVPAAADALAGLTGPVVVTQEDGAGGRGPAWVARFTLQGAPVLARLARRRECPTADTWEYLTARGWTLGEAVEVPVAYVRLAPAATALRAGGASYEVIATALGVPAYMAQYAVLYAETGLPQRPACKPGKRTGTGGGPPKYQTLAPEVARLRDAERWSFRRIGRQLGIGEGTVRKAYDLTHRAAVAAAARAGRPPERGRWKNLPAEVHRAAAERLRRGEPAAEIARAVGCSVNTVRRIKAALTD